MGADKNQTQEEKLHCHYFLDGQTYNQVQTCKSHNGYRMNRQVDPTLKKENEINFVWNSEVHNYLVHSKD